MTDDERTKLPEGYHVFSDLMDESDPGSWGASMWSLADYVAIEHETRAAAIAECWAHADKQREIGRREAFLICANQLEVAGLDHWASIFRQCAGR